LQEAVQRELARVRRSEERRRRKERRARTDVAIRRARALAEARREVRERLWLEEEEARLSQGLPRTTPTICRRRRGVAHAARERVRRYAEKRKRLDGMSKAERRRESLEIALLRLSCLPRTSSKWREVAARWVRRASPEEIAALWPASWGAPPDKT
jgi:hypothetical protein